MKRILQMAAKDLKLISRDKMGLFFIAVFPIVMGLFFGSIMNIRSGGSGTGKLKVAIVDNDNSEISQQFVASLTNNDQLAVETTDEQLARESVRKGERVGMIVLPQGFGETAGVFWNEPPKIQVGLDPSKTAESAMLQGFLMQSMGDLIGYRFQQPQQFKPFIDKTKQQLTTDTEISGAQRVLLTSFLGSVESMLDTIDQLQQQDDQADGEVDDAWQSGMQFAEIDNLDVTREIDPDSIRGQLKNLDSRWDMSFPQAMLWGVLGCVAGFAISIARERTLGTMLRLQVAPISKAEILAGKAMACFFMTLAVIGLLTLIGFALGLRPASFPKLIVASLCIAFCFVGIMMVMSALGRTEQSINGAGWAVIIVLSMIGGGMVPVMFLPDFLQTISGISPVKWAIQSIEGAVWRRFTWAEMMLPLGILVGIGSVSLTFGVAIMYRRDR